MKTTVRALYLCLSTLIASQSMSGAVNVGGAAALDVSNWTTNNEPYVQGTMDGFVLNWENGLTNSASANIANNNFDLTFETDTNYTIGHLFLYNEVVDLSTIPGGIQQLTWVGQFDATNKSNWIPVIAVTDGGITNFYRSNNTGNTWNGAGVLNFTSGAADNAFWVGLSDDPQGGINETRVEGQNADLQSATGMVQFGFIQWDASTGGIVSPAAEFTTAVARFEVAINEVPLPTQTLDSARFEARYSGNQIYDGAMFINDWAEPGLGGTDVIPSLSGEILTLTNNANNGWIELNNGSTIWENGVAAGGSWTVEVRIRLADAAGNGFVIWAANGIERGVMQIDTAEVSSFGGPVLDDEDNTDEFHTFRMAYDAELGLYFFWRDGVLLTPDGGLPRQATTAESRFILGDCCSSFLMTSVEIEYANFDTTGAYAPAAGGPRIQPVFSQDSGTGELTVSWDSDDGRLYNLRSAADPSAADPRDWPIFDGREDIVATPPTNSVSFPLPEDSERFFVVESFPAPPVSVFFDDFENGIGEWSTGVDGLAGTEWELGVPSGGGPVAANSPDNCFGTNISGSYMEDAEVWLRSPEIDLTDAEGATLSYVEFRAMEEEFDFGLVRVLDASDGSELALLSRQVDGFSTDWGRVTKKLPSDALGKMVVIEFRFDSDELEHFAGWYLDDVKVTIP